MIPTNFMRDIITSRNDMKNERPKRKRAGLVDLSNAISSTLHISSSADEHESEKFEKVSLVRARSEERTPRCEVELDLDSDSSDSEEADEQSVRNEDEGREKTECQRDPCPEFDYDATNHGDPFQVPDYAMDIFCYYAYRELKFRAFDYLPRHPLLKKVRRAKIVDWFVRCQEDFEVNHEVLYHTVKLFDLYLCLTFNMEEFDYIGAAALIIAAKVDQQDPPTVDDFPNFTDPRRYAIVNEYERKILTAFSCDINFPLSYRFLRRFSRAGGMDMVTLTMARYILETSLLFYEFICVPDSMMAAASLLLAMKMLKIGEWSVKLRKYSGYPEELLEPLMWRLNHMMKMRSKVYPQCISIEEKYSHGVFYHVAGVQLLPDTRPRNEPVGPPSVVDFHSVLLD